MASFTIAGCTLQRISVYSAGNRDVYGNGQARTLVLDNILARFVEKGKSHFQIMQKGPVTLGSAQAWIDGDAPIMKGHIVVAEDTKQEYTVIEVTKGRDVIMANHVDHTHILLE